MKAIRGLDVPTALLIVCAVAVTLLVARRELRDGPRPASTVSIGGRKAELSDWHRFASEGHRVGPSDAPLAIVLFTDFECPSCRVLASQLRVLQAEFPGGVQVITRHYPGEGHPHAEAAALAAECAADQDRFQEFHDALFDNQSLLGSTSWQVLARLAGVPDLDSFGSCLEDADSSRLMDDIEAGRELGVQGTPTLILNGVLWLGAPGLDTLRTLATTGRPGRP